MKIKAWIYQQATVHMVSLGVTNTSKNGLEMALEDLILEIHYEDSSPKEGDNGTQ